MPPSSTVFGDSVWELPPLILYPFNEHVSPAALLENSRAALMLSGLLADDGADPEILTRRLLSGCYTETRMLFFLGKDVLRWMEQCLESTDRIPEWADAGVRAQSFAGILTTHPPETVKAKLAGWGVTDHFLLFSRALGLNTVFRQPPPVDLLSDEFLHNYHRYADFLYRCYMESTPHCSISAVNFHFDLYASGEYFQRLESEWNPL